MVGSACLVNEQILNGSRPWPECLLDFTFRYPSGGRSCGVGSGGFMSLSLVVPSTFGTWSAPGSGCISDILYDINNIGLRTWGISLANVLLRARRQSADRIGSLSPRPTPHRLRSIPDGGRGFPDNYAVKPPRLGSDSHCGI